MLPLTIFQAIATGSITAVREMLTRTPSPVNERDENGYSTLMYVAQLKGVTVDVISTLTDSLVRSGVDINAVEFVKGNTALHLGCRAGNFAFLRSEEHTSELQSLMRNSYAVFR